MLDSSAVVAVISTVFGFVDLSLTAALPLSENVLTTASLPLLFLQ